MVMMQRLLLASLVGVSYAQTKKPKKNLSASVKETATQTKKPKKNFLASVKKTAAASKNVWQSIQKQSESAIVQIISYTVQPDLLRPYTKESSEGRGSGAFVEGGKGLILTCFHVIENCSKVGIQMPLYFGKRMVEATVVGVCPDYDMALLQLDPAVCAHIEKEYGSLPFFKIGRLK